MTTSFYDRRIETLQRDRLRALQEQGLARLMDAVSHSAFHRDKLARSGAEPSRVRRLEDLCRLPFTTKAELVESQREHPPYGTLPSFPLWRYRYMHQTSGTSGAPLRWLDTEEDFEAWARCWEYVYRGAGVGEDDVVFAAFSFGPYVAHWAAMAGARSVGALGVAGGGLHSLGRLETLLDNRCTVLVSTPTYALRLAEVAAQQGIDLRGSPVRVTIHAGEPGASVPNVKRRIEEGWGAVCFDHAGATEVGAWAFDCQAQTGSIHLNEAEFIFEVVDPTRGEPVSAGERGELVVTNLHRFGMPVVRYRTGDLVERIDEPCPCGRTLDRLRGGILGRADDMFVVRGVNLYPSAIDNIVHGIRGVAEYEVEIRRGSGLDELAVSVETEAPEAFPQVERSLRDAMRTRFNLQVSVRNAAPGSLPRYELKARRYKRSQDPG